MEKLKNKMMKMTTINTLLLIAILGYLVVGHVTDSGDDRQAYVITGDLFAEFEYQKELDYEFRQIKEKKEQELNQFKNELIGLETKIRSGVATEAEQRDYQIGFERFQKLDYLTTEEIQKLNADYAMKIWDKLNAFVSTYGEENGYDVIFGTSGEGNILYADKSLDITEDVIAYCNNKYSGK